jgi:hypothetical protein
LLTIRGFNTLVRDLHPIDKLLTFVGMEVHERHTQLLQRIWAIDLMESWFCIWDDLANPKIGLNLVPNTLEVGDVVVTFEQQKPKR